MAIVPPFVRQITSVGVLRGASLCRVLAQHTTVVRHATALKAALTSNHRFLFAQSGLIFREVGDSFLDRANWSANARSVSRITDIPAGNIVLDMNVETGRFDLLATQEAIDGIGGTMRCSYSLYGDAWASDYVPTGKNLGIGSLTGSFAGNDHPTPTE